MKISFNWSKKKPFLSNISIDPCLTKDEAEKFRRLDFEQLMDMSSEGRIKVFMEFIDEEKAVFVNYRLERDLILKSQKEGFMNYINGKDDIEPKWREEIIREITLLDKALSKEELDSFTEKLLNLPIVELFYLDK